MNKFKRLNILLLTMGLFAVGVFYQNCGQMNVISSHTSISSLSDWFDYPYTTKPAAYGEVYLFRPKGLQTEQLVTYEVVGSVAPADDSNRPISYIMTIKDESGANVCPTQTGTDRSIRFSCVGFRSASAPIVVELKISYDSHITYLQKIF